MLIIYSKSEEFRIFDAQIESVLPVLIGDHVSISVMIAKK